MNLHWVVLQRIEFLEDMRGLTVDYLIYDSLGMRCTEIWRCLSRRLSSSRETIRLGYLARNLLFLDEDTITQML